MRGLYLKCIIACSLFLALILASCGSVKNVISVSSDAVSLNEISVSFNVVSDNSINNVDGLNGAVSEDTVLEDSVSEDSVSEDAASEDVDIDEAVVSNEFVSVEDAVSGNYILYGSYEQDGDTSNGSEPIEWIVLDEYENSILVLSRYVIEKKAFNDTDTEVYWSQSSIRSWLNDEFITEAFSDNEAEKIVASILDNPGSSGYFGKFEKNGGTATGNNTEDKVFLLSYADVLKYYEASKVDKYYVYASPDLITKATVASGIENVALSQDEYEAFYKEEGWPQECVGLEGSGWFLRSHGFNSDDVMSVGYDGGIRGYYFAYGADYESVTFEGGIRPAMWIER